jgi:hypothetical protein
VRWTAHDPQRVRRRLDEGSTSWAGRRRSSCRRAKTPLPVDYLASSARAMVAKGSSPLSLDGSSFGQRRTFCGEMPPIEYLRLCPGSWRSGAAAAARCSLSTLAAGCHIQSSQSPSCQWRLTKHWSLHNHSVPFGHSLRDACWWTSDLLSTQRAVEQQDAADEVRAFTMAALAADLGVMRTL